MMKRFASHYLLIPGVGFVKQQVVEISDEGVAQNIFPLNEEVESVEWLPGLIVLLSVHQMEEIRNTGMVVFYPFDFISMLPVDGTRHRLLR